MTVCKHGNVDDDGNDDDSDFGRLRNENIICRSL